MTQLLSHPRLIRKLQEAFGDQLCVALEDASVVEIMLNPDGRLYIERLGHGMAAAGEMSSAAAEIVIGSVAHALNSEADDEQPIISGELPIGGHRFEGLLPPVVRAPTFTIRRRASRLIPLDDYVKARVMTGIRWATAVAAIIRSIVFARGRCPWSTAVFVIRSYSRAQASSNGRPGPSNCAMSMSRPVR